MAPVTSNDRATYTNKRICDSFGSIFDMFAPWGYNKPPHQTFHDYLSAKKIEKTRIKNALNKDMHKLNETSFKTLDLSGGCAMLPLLWDPNIKDGHEWKNITDENEIEYHLNKLRQLRNKVMHEPEGSAVDPNLLDEVEVIILKVLDIAAHMHSPGQDRLDNAKDSVRKLVSDIKSIVSTEKEQKSEQFGRMMKDKGIKELRLKPVSFVDESQQHVKSFYDLTLSENGRDFSCKNILEYFSDSFDHRIICLRGQSGSGKSFMLKEIHKDILKMDTNSPFFTDVMKFDIPFLFKCNSLSCRTLPELVRQSIPSFANEWKDTDLVDAGLSQVKCLFLVDGLDEMNFDSQSLVVGSLIPFLKNHPDSSCIITSRPHALNSLQNLITDEITYKIFDVQKLTTKEEQIEFLSSSCENGQQISCTYQRSGMNLQLPMHLNIYASFCSHDTERIKSSNHMIMREVIKHNQIGAIERLKQRSDQNLSPITDTDVRNISIRIVETLSFLGFYLLLNDKLDIKEDDAKWLQKETDKITSNFNLNISPSELLSCFLHHQCSNSVFRTYHSTYDFYNKSHQETFAAVFLDKHEKELQKGVYLFIVCVIARYEGISAEQVKKKMQRKDEYKIEVGGNLIKYLQEGLY